MVQKHSRHRQKKIKGIPPPAFWIVNVANDRPMKGIPYLLKAMQYIPANLPIHLILIGKNTDHNKNKKIVASSSNKNKIHFLGYRTDALNIVKAADVFVLSSLYGEATTKAVIEAMSLGTAPVITDIPGNDGLVINGQSGLTVPPKNSKAMAAAILKLYHQNKLCEIYGQKAKAHIEKNFHIRDTIREMKKIYSGTVHYSSGISF